MSARSHRDHASVPTRGHLPGVAPRGVVRFLPDLRVPFCFPLANRAELLFGDQEGHHVFPVVGFSFQPLTVRLGLRVPHLAAHIVFGLNLGHSGEPTTAWPSGANTSAAFVRHEYSGSHGAPRQRAAPPFHAAVTFDLLCPAWAERADRRPKGAGTPGPTSPVAGPHRPSRKPGVGHHRRQIVDRLGFSLPDPFSSRISRWLHHIHAIHCHHAVSSHLRNCPHHHCLVQLKIARGTPRLLGCAM